MKPHLDSPAISGVFKWPILGLFSVAVVTFGAGVQGANGVEEPKPWDLFTDMTSTNRDLSIIGERVLRLLDSQDAERFALEMAPAITDWRPLKTNPDPLGPEFETGLNYQRKEVADSARLVLDQAARLGVAPARVRFRLKEVLGKTVSGYRNLIMQAEGDTLPSSFDIKIILLGEPVGNDESDESLKGEYELGLGVALSFPADGALTKAFGGVDFLTALQMNGPSVT